MSTTIGEYIPLALFGIIVVFYCWILHTSELFADVKEKIPADKEE